MSIKFEEVDHIYAKGTPFQFHALKNINLNIKEKSFTAIIGHTGSGKSTLIQHINALSIPTEGKVSIQDFVIYSNKKNSNLKGLRKKAGVVFQFPEYQLFEETVEKDIMFGPMNFGISEDDARKICVEMIELVGLDQSYLKKSPFELSGGQKRRVAIAGILSMKPDILVLDEPTAGLDPQGSKQMMDLFTKINNNGTTIILVTHDMNHVLHYCDRVVLLEQGQIVTHDTVRNIFSNDKVLNDLNIELPSITKTIQLLNNNGFDIDMSITSIEKLALEIKEKLHG